MHVSGLMSTDVRLADPDMTLQEAATLMRDGDFGVLSVGENVRLVGIITDRDIAVRAAPDGRDPRSATARETAIGGIRWCYGDAPTLEAARRTSAVGA